MSAAEPAGLSARFRHMPFLDLLADAAHNHLRAQQEADPYAASRAARASIIASYLSVECFANCLINDVDVSSSMAPELDKMPALTKIDWPCA